jgi:NADPH:quinone reductase-like Zn-dependent oxidoreductase
VSNSKARCPQGLSANFRHWPQPSGAVGIDVVIDPVGGELRARALGQLAPFGRFLVLGNASGQDPALSGDAVWPGTCQLIGLASEQSLI